MPLKILEMILFALISISPLTWEEIGIKNTGPALRGVSGTLAAHGEQKNALADADLDPRHITLGPF